MKSNFIDKVKIEKAVIEDADALATLRTIAMQESLEAVGRFCPNRARERFLANFNPKNTKKLIIEGTLAGFYVLAEHPVHLLLDHLYIHPVFQGMNIGSFIMHKVIEIAEESGKEITLGALKKSKSNNFYLSHGFIKTHEGEFDNYYIYKIVK
ncbi:hypothetical protein AB833_10520 [Chromatiales bacterium (ex Bugula neritina AB1)]|nr:hypothetical protein AB833_10520 [Chromatiales bacterium (ex Bugula neritina AB1)]